MFTEATLSQLVLLVKMENLPFSNRTKILVTGLSTNHKYIYVVNNGAENNMSCCGLGTLREQVPGYVLVHALFIKDDL